MIGNDAGELRATQADRDVLEALDDALGFLMDAEREIVLEALVRHRLSTEARQALSTTPTPDRFGEGYRAGVELRVAKAIEGPHVPVPAGSKFTLDELREVRWLHLSKQDQGMRLNEAKSAIRALQPATGDEA